MLIKTPSQCKTFSSQADHTLSQLQDNMRCDLKREGRCQNVAAGTPSSVPKSDAHPKCEDRPTSPTRNVIVL